MQLLVLAMLLRPMSFYESLVRREADQMSTEQNDLLPGDNKEDTNFMTTRQVRLAYRKKNFIGV